MIKSFKTINLIVKVCFIWYNKYRRKWLFAEGVSEMKKGTNCEYCINYYYDDEYECYACAVNMDEDDVYRYRMDSGRGCPYFRMGDDYTIVKKQI